MSALLDRAKLALTGEPARFIAYGAAIALVGLVSVFNALGITRFGAGISLTDALVGTTAAITTLVGIVESIRRYVYSPNTVSELLTDASADVPETETAAPDGAPTV